MGQYWLIRAPQRKETSNNLGKFGQVLFSSVSDCLATILARPEVDIKLIKSIWQQRDYWRDMNRSKTLEFREPKPILSLLCLPGLPSEILAMIVQVLDYPSILKLAVTSSYFWKSCRSRLFVIQASLLGSWAGEKIVCLGDYVSASDHPPGMFTEQEKRDLSRTALPYDEESDDVEEDRRYNNSLSMIASETYREIQFSQSRKRRHLSLSPSCIQRNLWPKAQSLPPDIEESLTRIKEIFYPEHRAFILRNLTTQEYVRAEGITRHPEYIHGPKIDRVGFGHVVLMRICWSSDSSGVSRRGINRGKWAGHRFEVTTVERHERSIKADEQWKDVSVQVREEIKDIWEFENGDY
ncbi:hypothetical protein MMC17_001743 [Xylographa soralifera]|nr:hypothetical protein [Xylographa soralifera]